MVMWHNVLMVRTATTTATTAKMLNEYLQEWLGTRAESEQKMVDLVEGGLPTKVVNHLIERGLTRKEVFDIIIPLRTWKHRKSRRQPLSKEESERAVRAARILARAQAVWGDQESALNWLRAPKKRFEGRSPLQMLSTETGGRLVEQMLIQIDEGMFA
jgi:putative toxin-antitoxin system antitoxin component (TIGR02293 family)